MNILKQKLYFNKNHNQYNPSLIENPPFHTQLELSIFLEILRKWNISNNIIDFGAGTGRVSIFLLKNNFSIAAVDISENSLNNLKSISKKLSLSKIQLLQEIPKNKKYKAIIGADILHHVDLSKYFPMFYNSLEKGGKILFSEPGAFNPTWHIYLGIFHDWQIEKGFTQCRYFHLYNLLEKNGFRKIRVRGLGFFPRPFFNWSKKLCELNDKLGDLPFFKLFAYRYIIEAEK